MNNQNTNPETLRKRDSKKSETVKQREARLARDRKRKRQKEKRKQKNNGMRDL